MAKKANKPSYNKQDKSSVLEKNPFFSKSISGNVQQTDGVEQNKTLTDLDVISEVKEKISTISNQLQTVTVENISKLKELVGQLNQTVSSQIASVSDINKSRHELFSHVISELNQQVAMICSNESLNQYGQLVESFDAAIAQITKDRHRVLQKENDLKLEQSKLNSDILANKSNWELEKERLADESQSQIDSLERKLKFYQEQIQQRKNENKLEVSYLNAFSDKYDSPQNIIDKITELEEEVNKYKFQAMSASMQQNAPTQAELELINTNLTLAQELNRFKKQEMTLKNITHQHDVLLTRNRVLQSRHDILKDEVDLLEEKVNGVINKKNKHRIFNALNELDAIEVPNPDLDFSHNLQSFAEYLRNYLANRDEPLYYSLENIRLFIAGLAMSKLHIFQGISGTGKTSLAKAFIEAISKPTRHKQYKSVITYLNRTIVPVQAGWRDRDDLFGYYNAFEKKYYVKEFLRALYLAQTPSYKDKFNVIILDEMNLSKPEQYFSEILSAIESKEPISLLDILDNDDSDSSPKHLIDGRKILIPDNVWFIGTANHDSTTFEFADKTHDRAFVLDLLPKDIQEFQPPQNFAYSDFEFDVHEFNSLVDSSIMEHKLIVNNILKELQQSDFAQVLNQEFEIGWGNRFNEQIRRFLPVVKSSGGSFGLALDHLLSTRIIRKGKVLNRYDIKIESLEYIEECLKEFWSKNSEELGTKAPNICLENLSKEIKKNKNE